METCKAAHVGLVHHQEGLMLPCWGCGDGGLCLHAWLQLAQQLLRQGKSALAPER